MGCSSISTNNDNYVKKEVESLNITIPENEKNTQKNRDKKPNFSAEINNVDSNEKISQMNQDKKDY